MDFNFPELPDEAAKEAVESLDKHIGGTYDNIVLPPSKEAGDGIAAMIKLVFSSVKYFGTKADMFFAYKLKAYQNELEQKLQSIPTENQTEPDFHTLLEAIEHSRFCITDDELRAMFVNLIAGTVNSETSEFVHPAFAAIIRQMSSIDAAVLQLAAESPSALTSEFIAYKLHDIDEQKVRTALDNLVRLGLVQCNRSVTYQSMLEYERDIVEASKPFRSVPLSSEIELTESGFELTAFGRQFCRICCQ